MDNHDLQFGVNASSTDGQCNKVGKVVGGADEGFKITSTLVFIAEITFIAF